MAPTDSAPANLERTGPESARPAPIPRASSGPRASLRRELAGMSLADQVARITPGGGVQMKADGGLGAPDGSGFPVQMDTGSGVAGSGGDFTAIKPEDTLSSEHFKTFETRYKKLLSDLGKSGDPTALWLKVVRQLQASNPTWQSAPTVSTGRGPRTDLESAAARQVMGDLTGIIGEVKGLMDLQAKNVKEWSFWSGRPSAEVAKSIGTCLETSALGSLFDGININGKWDIGLWGALSASYAEAVANNLQDDSVLRGFVGQGSSTDQSIFNKIEQPKFNSICEERGLTPTVTWFACVGKPGDVGTVDDSEVTGGIKGCIASGDRGSMVSLAESENAKRAAMPKSPDVQPAGGVATGGSDDVQRAAAAGVSGSGGRLPHFDAIQHAFGGHDLSGVQAHVGGKAAEASRSMGAQAYATGDQIAFKSAPDLHTAAHEAAHVVQQRAGVSLPGGVGRAGDAYERHADAVADAVVGGRSAEPLLSAAGGGAAAVQRSVQMRHGDIGTAAGEDLLQAACARLGVSYEDAVAWAQQKHGSDFHFVTVEDAVEFLYRRSSRDEYFNNAVKVNFESQLGANLLRARSFYEASVFKVSGACLAYIDKKAEKEGKSAADILNQLEGMYGGKVNEAGQRVNNWEQDLYYGRLQDDLLQMGQTLDEAKQHFAAQMRAVFEGQGGSIPNHVFAHHQFWDHVYGPDAPEFEVIEGRLVEIGTSRATQYIEELNAEGQELEAVKQKSLRYGAGTENAPNAFGVGAEGQEVHGVGDDPQGKKYKDGPNAGQVKPADMRGRYFRGELGSPSVSSSSGIRARGSNDASADNPQAATTVKLGQAHGGGQVHGRGVDRWTMDERQRFIQEARIVLDMPLGGGISGTTTDLMEVGQFAGLSGNQEKFGYALAVLAHLATAGAHSFHEIMVAASTAGIPYVPGDYYSTLQALGALEIPEIKALTEQQQYKNVKGISGPV